MNKRGISTVVATVLVILLSVAMVGIVWLGVMPMINDIDIDKSAGLKLVSSEGYTLWDSESRLATVQIERAGSSPNIVGIDIVFSLEGNSVTHFVDDVPGVNGKKVYYVNLSGYEGELDSISIVPIFWGGVVGDVASELKIERIGEADIVEMIEEGVVDGDDFVEPSGSGGGSGGGGSGGGGDSDSGDEEEEGDVVTPETCYTIDVCGNNIDDNCNGEVDEEGCISVNSRLTNAEVISDSSWDHWAAGELVDRMDIGYLHLSEASGDSVDPDGDLNDWDDSMGEHNVTTCTPITEFSTFYTGCSVDFDLNAPEAGYYVFGFYAWNSNTRNMTPMYGNGYEIITMDTAHKSISLYLVEFDSPGKKRFMLYGNDRNYLFHVQLYKLREDPVNILSNDHPRFILHHDSIEEFREDLNQGWVGEMSSGTVGGAEYILSNTDISIFSACSSRGNLGSMSDLAIAYLLTGNTNYSDYGIEALKLMTSMDTWQCNALRSYLSNGELGLATAIGYDAFYDQMSEEDKNEIIKGSDRLYNDLFIHSVNAEHQGDSSHWWSRYVGNNWNPVINGGGLGTGSIAFKGDNKYTQQWQDQAIKTQKRFLESGFDEKGAYSESLMYLGYALGNAALFYDSLNVIEGINLMEYNNEMFRKAIYMKIFFTEPDRSHGSTFDDESRWSFPDYARYNYVGVSPQIFTLASSFNDAIAQRFMRMTYGDLKEVDRFHNYAGNIARSLFDYKSGGGDVSLNLLLPMAKLYPDFGRVMMRTGYEDKKDYYFAMQCGLYGSHGQADQSSFIIHALGEVLIDDDGYGTLNTSFHNAILVDGEGQKVEDSGTMENHGGQFDSFIHSDKIDYVLANSTEGYVRNGVNINYNLRNFIFVRPTENTDGYYVLADRINSDVSHEYKWNIHHRKNGNVLYDIGNNNFRLDTLLSVDENYPDDNASLQIMISSPALFGNTYDSSASEFSIVPSVQSSEEHFTVLFYPTDETHLMPVVNKVDNSDFSGFEVGNDLVLYNKDSLVHTYSDVVSDAEVLVVRDDDGLEFISMLEGTTLTYDGVDYVSASVRTNVVIVSTGDGYNVSLGSEVEDFRGVDSLTVSIGGLVVGRDYDVFEGGVLQGTFGTDGNGVLEYMTDNGFHDLVVGLVA